MNKRLGFAVAALSLFCYGASEAGFSRSDVDEKKTENKDAAASGGEAPAAPSEGVKTDGGDTEKKDVSGDPVVLRIDGKEFRRSEVMEDAKLLPPQMLQGVSQENLFNMLLEQKMRNYLLVRYVKTLGIEESKDYKDEKSKMEEALLLRFYVIKHIAPKANVESTLKAEYTRYIAEYKKVKEYHINHIVVSTEEASKAVLADLNAGKDFGEVAKARSESPTKESGGDEGYIPLEAFPAEVKDKISALKKGEFTKEAIKMGNGFNFFKVVDTRDSAPMKYDEAKDMLRQLVLRKEMLAKVTELEKKAKIEKFREDGTSESADTAKSEEKKNETAPVAPVNEEKKAEEPAKAPEAPSTPAADEKKAEESKVPESTTAPAAPVPVPTTPVAPAA